MRPLRSFTASDLTIFMQHLSGIRMMLPSQVKLLPAERRSMFKLNSKKHVFVESALKYMKMHPEMVPAGVDVSTCNNFLLLYHQYTELLEELEKVKTQMEDVKLQIGNNVMKMTRAYFQNTRFASQSGIRHAEPIYQQLKMNYAVGRNSRKS